MSLRPCNDGLIRGSRVSVYRGRKKCKLLRHSVAHLYPLEINTNNVGELIDNQLTNLLPNDHINSLPNRPTDSSSINSETCYPSRRAAIAACDCIVAQRLQLL